MHNMNFKKFCATFFAERREWTLFCVWFQTRWSNRDSCKNWWRRNRGETFAIDSQDPGNTNAVNDGSGSSRRKEQESQASFQHLPLSLQISTQAWYALSQFPTFCTHDFVTGEIKRKVSNGGGEESSVNSLSAISLPPKGQTELDN